MGRDSNAVRTSFGERLRLARLARGWTQATVAERAGLHWTYVGHVECGRRNPTLYNIVLLAAAVDVDAGVLLQGLHEVSAGAAAPAIA